MSHPDMPGSVLSRRSFLATAAAAASTNDCSRTPVRPAQPTRSPPAPRRRRGPTIPSQCQRVVMLRILEPVAGICTVVAWAKSAARSYQPSW
jgi:hypothetical protein